MIHHCNTCGQKLILGKNWTKASSQYYEYICLDCLKKRAKNWRANNLPHVRSIVQKSYYKNKEQRIEKQHQDYEKNKKILQQLKSNGCAICGYNKCDASLDFHHTNPKDKKFQISSSALDLKTERVVNELNKCILLCRNCHGEIHFLEKNKK